MIVERWAQPKRSGHHVSPEVLSYCEAHGTGFERRLAARQGVEAVLRDSSPDLCMGLSLLLGIDEQANLQMIRTILTRNRKELTHLSRRHRVSSQDFLLVTREAHA
jgi:hypothetical protein